MANNAARLFVAILIAGTACAAPGDPKGTVDPLNQFSASVQTLTRRVAPSVVQIVVERYGNAQTAERRTSEDMGAGRSIGSGVIVDSGGYIVTNAHVIEDARRIRVRLSSPASTPSSDDADAISAALDQPFAPLQDATLVGSFKESDLALIKISATGLPALPFADYKKLRQGQVVFAFGSREGLQNSVSMGVISSVARQVADDSPFLYIQTDAAINPGDSGGPLVNTAGEIVGLDTFILSQSGGSEGIGFAIPSSLVQLVSSQLKERGHFHRQLVGVGVQTITPTLSAALHLNRSAGVIVTDILPGGPADSAGIKLRDIVLSVNGSPIKNLPLFMMNMLGQPGGGTYTFDVLRGDQSLSLKVVPVEESHAADRVTDLIEPGNSELPALGLIGVTVGARNQAMFPDLRADEGIYVAARSRAAVPGLQIGDVIHDLNGTEVKTVEDLRQLSSTLKHGEPAALLVEREHKMLYVAFQVE